MDLNKKVDQLLKELKSENFKKVILDGEKLLKKYSDKGYLYNICGLAYQRINKIETSINFFKKAINLEPSDPGNKNNLANSYIILNEFEKAEKIFKKILSVNPSYAPVLVNYARLKNIILDYKNAIIYYKSALKLIKNDLSIWCNLASVYENSGDFNEANNIYKNILKHYPNYTPAHISISKINNYSENKINLEQMIELEKVNNLQKKDKSDLKFSIGKACEDQKKFDESIKYFESANKIRNELVDYNFRNEEKLSKSIKNYFKDINFKKIVKNNNPKKIIFIVGLPRSGTTLLELILSAHKSVFGAGELDFLRQITNKHFVQDNKLLSQKINEYIELNENIISDEYFKYLNNFNQNSIAIIDKSPLNFVWIGFIKFFFPNAKVIHSVRNLKDTFLSLYKNNFASKDMDWTYDPSNILKYFKFYSDQMEFWKNKCEDFIYDINYENVVDKSEDEIRKLLNFCDLPWDENCLKHHKNKKTMVKTVSIYQARKPIYKTSVNLSEMYSKHLDNYFKLLKN